MGKIIHIKTPATTANMGPGFDSVGMAFQLYNHIFVEETGKDAPALSISVRRGDMDEIPKDETNLVYVSLKRFYAEMGIESVPNVRIVQENNIPVTRGLGSSAACIVSGLFAANELSGVRASKEDIARLAAKIEGHPDNTNPAIMGGVVVGAMTGEKLDYLKLYTGLFERNDVQFAVMVPDFELSTELARNVLPKTYSREDAVFNLSRSAMLMAAFATDNLSKLIVAMEDRIHQPYRLPLVPNMDVILEKAAAFGALGSFLSGAGPTLIALFQQHAFEDKMRTFLSTLPNNWELLNLNPDYNGTTVEYE